MGKRGGYRRESPLYKLTFEDEQFDGLEVMAKSLPLGEFFALQRLQVAADNNDVTAAEQVVRKMSGVIVSWNLEDDDGKAVPAEFAVCTVSGKPGNPGDPCSAHGDGTAEGEPGACEYTGLIAQDLPFLLAIIKSWMEAVASVPNSSPSDSNAGVTSLELSIPMEAA